MPRDGADACVPVFRGSGAQIVDAKQNRKQKMKK